MDMNGNKVIYRLSRRLFLRISRQQDQIDNVDMSSFNILQEIYIFYNCILQRVVIMRGEM